MILSLISKIIKGCIHGVQTVQCWVRCQVESELCRYQQKKVLSSIARFYRNLTNTLSSPMDNTVIMQLIY